MVIKQFIDPDYAAEELQFGIQNDEGKYSLHDHLGKISPVSFLGYFYPKYNIFMWRS